MLLSASNYWTTLLNFIIQNYFRDSLATCMIWNDEIEFTLKTTTNETLQQFVHIKRQNLNESLDKDIYDFSAKMKKLEKNNLQFDDFVLKLTVAIENSHCESFVAFQQDIPIFARAFRNASIFSIWRSLKTKFLFAYRKDLQCVNCFHDYLFRDQANILIVESESENTSHFRLLTNKFVGPVAENQAELYLLNEFDGIEEKFSNQNSLYPDKIKDLEGREIVLGIFDYRPFVAIDYEKQPQVHDHAADNPNGSALVDGTEVRLLLTFCEMYNCTVQIDSSEKGEWGFMYPNSSGDGLLGMIVERKTEIALGALYSWYIDYIYLDLSTFLGRSGITCMVPVPTRLTSWNLPLKPFQFTLWLGVIACLIAETIALLFTRRLEHNDDSSEINSWYHSFQFGYITTLKLFISQGTDYVVNSTSVRTVLFSCYMIDIIITSIYGGGLASILTLPTLGEAADSLERLHRHGLKWTATSEDWVVTIRAVQDDPMIIDILKKYVILTFDEMREKSKTEDMGFVVERLTFGHLGNGEFLTPESLNRLKLMIDDIYFQFTVAFVPRLWAFLAKFNNLIYMWHSSGFDKFWEWKVTAHFLNGNEQNQALASMTTNYDTGPVELDLANFAGLILVWIIGMSLSLIAFALELLGNKYLQQTLNKRLKEEALSNIIY